MGHYDSDYMGRAAAIRAEERKGAAAQLELMNSFISSLITTCGDRGISKRHLDAFQDMINETKLRTI